MFNPRVLTFFKHHELLTQLGRLCAGNVVWVHDHVVPEVLGQVRLLTTTLLHGSWVHEEDLGPGSLVSVDVRAVPRFLRGKANKRQMGY